MTTSITGAASQEMSGVREYDEQLPVALVLVPPDDEVPKYGPSPAEGPRWCVRALNEGGYNGVSIDLLDLIRWLRENRPELLLRQQSKQGD